MKKRMILVLLVCGLILSATVHVSGAKAGQELDAAFEAGRIVIAGTRIPVPDPMTCEIVMPPDSFWEDCIQEKPGEDQLRQDLAAGMTVVFSIAPDGSCAVGYLGDIPVIFRDGKVLVMHPAGYGEGEEPDVSARYCCRQLYGYEYQKQKGKKTVTIKVDGQFYIEIDGFKWSPDGRYLSIIDTRDISQQSGWPNTSYPVLTDTQTGEMFSVDDKLTDESGSESLVIWEDGCFSEDGKYFWAVHLKTHNPMEYVLLRYELDTFEREVFTVSEDHAYGLELPSLWTCPEGGAVMLPQYETEDNYWLLQADSGGAFSLRPLVRESPIRYLYPVRIIESGKTGEALVLYRGGIVLSDYYGYGYPVLPVSCGLVHVRMNEPGNETDTIWLIRSDTLETEAITTEMMKDYTRCETMEEVYAIHNRYLVIYDMAMSPDGKYAAVLTAGSNYDFDQTKLLFIRLADMKALPAELILPGEASGKPVSVRNNDLIWSEAGLLLYWSQIIFPVQ